jgi:hypothetical protein
MGLCKSESVEIRKSDYIIILFLWFLSETQAKINQRVESFKSSTTS